MVALALAPMLLVLENDCEVRAGVFPCSDNGSNANNSVSEVRACLGSTSESNASSLDAGFDICCLGTQNTTNSRVDAIL